MLPACRLKLMISSLTSIYFKFHLPVDFGFNVIFPHNFSVLHHNSMEISWFSFTMHESPFTEEKSMQYSLEASGTRMSILLLWILRRSASALSKNTLKYLNQTWDV
jgi:hypothetical protein